MWETLALGPDCPCQTTSQPPALGSAAMAGRRCRPATVVLTRNSAPCGEAILPNRRTKTPCELASEASQVTAKLPFGLPAIPTLAARPDTELSFISALLGWPVAGRTRRPKMPSPAEEVVWSSLCQTTTASPPLRTRILGWLWKPAVVVFRRTAVPSGALAAV